MPIPKGSAVKQVVHPISGTVTAIKFNDDTGTFEYLVTYLTTEGDSTERWFSESEVEAI